MTMRCGGAFVVLLLTLFANTTPAAATDWTAEEMDALRSLWIGSLPPVPADPSNPVADDPRAVEFGHRLFFDTRLSANNAVACATCHKPELAFTDGKLVAEGIATATRNTPTLLGIAYSPWFFWDGRKDSLWSQALGPLENPVEHGMDRAGVVDVVRHDADYRRRYTDLFGALPEPSDAVGLARTFANLGRAMAAYERKLVPAPSRFDRYVAASLKGELPEPEGRLTQDEIEGLRAFIADNKGQCMRCHNGPLLTDNSFHNIGSDIESVKEEEQGRFDGIRLALADEFNCLGSYSGAPVAACAELRFAKQSSEELLGAFKTPTLRGLAQTRPYMHRGQYSSLETAVRHYMAQPQSSIGKSELEPLALPQSIFDQIEAFLLTLDSPVAAPDELRMPPRSP